MSQQHINYGASPNDGTGDTLRVSQIKAESNFNELYSNKVDKVTGKGLSDTNFTQVEKDKLAGLTEGGQVQSDWDQGDSGEVDFIKNKPENVSDFFNDSEYITDVPTVGSFVRSNSEWIALSAVSFPKIQITATAGQTVFPIGTTILAKAVFREGALLDDGDWSQSGSDITTIFPFELNERFKPI